MKVLLAYLCNYRDRHDYYLSLLPYGLVSIAASLQERGIDVALANYSREGHKKAAAMIRKVKPGILGVSIFSFNRTESLNLIETVAGELPGTIIIAGGPFASHLTTQLLERYPCIHHIVQGEGEAAMYHLVTDLNEGRERERVIQGERIADLDTLPPASVFDGPAHGVDMNEQNSFIITSRGCPGSCVYCCSPRFWGRSVSFRSAAKIVDEIEGLYRRKGIIYFSLRDDNFTLRKGRVMEFSEELIRRNIPVLWNCQARADTVDLEMLVAMKRAGLEHIQYGVESGSRAVLAMMDKKLTLEQIEKTASDTRKAGVLLSVYFMAGMPGEGEEDIAATIGLIRRIRPHDGIVSPVAYYPGTRLYDDLVADGAVTDNIWFQNGDSGLYARSDRAVSRWVRRIASELARGEKKNRYTHGEFDTHRSVAGIDCWVTELMEGDLFLDEGRMDEAGQRYGEVVRQWPHNIWGHVRMGELGRFMDDRDMSIAAFRSAAEICPAYYGSWFEMALAYFQEGDRNRAREYAAIALEMNPHNPEVKKLYERTLKNQKFH